MSFRRISIIGLGLIGGSLGMALCRTNQQLRVVGYDLSARTCQEALERRAVHEIAASLPAAVAEADLVILAVPVEKVRNVVEEAAPYLRPGTIVTDVASVKGILSHSIPAYLPAGVYYIGGHPMTGAEQSGIWAADPFLFQNAVYLLTPEADLPPDVATKLRTLISMIGGLPLLLKPEEHDLMVAVVSHLPHLTAAALVNVAARFEADYPGTLSLAAGGFRDTTRVALGSPELWRQIFSANRSALLKVVKELASELQEFYRQLESGEMVAVEERLREAAVVRSELPTHHKGFLTLLHELVVVIEDRPGMIAEVTGLLKEINIKDIEILRVREGEGGTLRLAFNDEQALTQAVELLRANGFVARVRGGKGR
ncbi:MAG: prephenate dehydrogenase [Firmicutes bacterium]|nr:prephenate dehydrogenase [Bacillota bacterium]